MRYLIHFSYDGTNFSGFQKQPNLRCVETEFEKALYSINNKQETKIIGAGRTDRQHQECSGLRQKGDQYKSMWHPDSWWYPGVDRLRDYFIRRHSGIAVDEEGFHVHSPDRKESSWGDCRICRLLYAWQPYHEGTCQGGIIFLAGPHVHQSHWTDVSKSGQWQMRG